VFDEACRARGPGEAVRTPQRKIGAYGSRVPRANGGDPPGSAHYGGQRHGRTGDCNARCGCAVARELTATTAVSTFAELSAAIAVDGASIDVTADIAVTPELVITGSVSITSSAGAALSGGGSNRLFYVNSGASLALSSLTLSDGYAVRVRFVIACFTYIRSEGCLTAVVAHA